MKTELSSLAPASFETEMLVVFAINKADKKDKKADPQIELLTPDEAVTSAAAKAVSGREFAAGSCETLLLHQPAGLKAARLLIVGVAKPTMAELRKAAGAAVRFAKPRSIRSLALLLPTATDFPAINTARAAIEGAIVADYDSDTYRSDRKDRSVETVTLLTPGGAAESTYKSGAQRRRHHCRVAELRPRADQRAGQRPHSHRVWSPRRRHGEGERPRLRGPLHRQAERIEDGRLSRAWPRARPSRPR